MASGPPTRIAFEDANYLGLSWTPHGHALLFSSARGPMGTSFLQRVSLSQEPDESIGQPERLPFGQGATDVTVAASGRLVYSAPFLDSAIWKLPLGALTDGPVAMPLLFSAFHEQTPDYSPDGKRLDATHGSDAESPRSSCQEKTREVR